MLLKRHYPTRPGLERGRGLTLLLGAAGVMVCLSLFAAVVSADTAAPEQPVAQSTAAPKTAETESSASATPATAVSEEIKAAPTKTPVPEVNAPANDSAKTESGAAATDSSPSDAQQQNPVGDLQDQTSAPSASADSAPANSDTAENASELQEKKDEVPAPAEQDDYQGPDDKPTLYQKEITPGELQDTVIRLISTYEMGNIDGFMALFAEHAQTNDRNNLRDIRDDYADLFETTADRQLFISDLNWDIKFNKATVVGKLEALIIYHAGQSMTRYSGKILIEVEKVGKKIYISKLMHILKR